MIFKLNAIDLSVVRAGYLDDGLYLCLMPELANRWEILRAIDGALHWVTESGRKLKNTSGIAACFFLPADYPALANSEDCP